MDERLFADARRTVNLLTERGWHVTFAESCTGGLAAGALVSVPDASRVFDGSYVTYANREKVRLLHVREDTIRTWGVVSEPVAGEMAAGCARDMAAEVGVGISGIAGPGGGTPQKPVGTVCFGFSLRGRVTTATMHFGDLGRDSVRQASVRYVFHTLAALLEEETEEGITLPVNGQGTPAGGKGEQMNETLGRRLARLRAMRGYDPERFARVAGIPVSLLTELESDQTTPDPVLAERLAALLGVSCAYLKNGGETDGNCAGEPDADRPAGGENRGAGANGGRSVARLVYSVYPPIVLIAFLLLGTLGGWWSPAWILFLTVPVVGSLVDAIECRNGNRFAYPVLALSVYLLLGVQWHMWHPWWVILITIPYYYLLFRKNGSRGFVQTFVGVVYPTLVLAAFLALGFGLGAWHPAWLLFLTVPLVCDVATAVSRRSAMTFSYPLLAALVYLAVGFLSGVWHPTWVIFLTVPIYYAVAKFFRGDRGA